MHIEHKICRFRLVYIYNRNTERDTEREMVYTFSPMGWPPSHSAVDKNRAQSSSQIHLGYTYIVKKTIE